MRRAWPVWALVLSAAAHPVPTGRPVEVEQRAPTLLLWVLPAGDTEMRVTVLGGSARVGDAVDLVDERGFLGRAPIISVESLRCGGTPYLDARVRTPKGLRRGTGQILAVLPAMARPARSRLLRATEVGDPPPRGRAGLQAIDLDGDGGADVARYVLYHCESHSPGAEAATCVENWNREDGRWKLVSAVDFRPPCR
jgi:hypothetical protein